jgi:hypothetical protein
MILFLDQTLGWSLPVLRHPYMHSFLHRTLCVWLFAASVMIAVSLLTEPAHEDKIEGNVLDASLDRSMGVADYRLFGYNLTNMLRGEACLSVLLWAAQVLPVRAANPCDPGLLQDKSNPYGYRLRGDRCEGIYIQEVSGAPLTIASWTESFDDYNLSSGAALVIEWEAPSSKSVHLRAQGMRRRLYFRMDASPGGASFSWRSDLLAAINIPKSELGVTGFYLGPVSGEEREILLPLRIGQKEKPKSSAAYRLVVIPGVEFKEMFVTLAAADGKSGVTLKNGEPLRYGYYPAGRPVEIPISGLPKPGIYHLQIGATLAASGAATADLWFYHSGK